MAVRRRAGKRRIDPSRSAEFWNEILESGYDFFNDAHEVGIVTDAYGRPDREDARAAWEVYGPQIVADRDPRLGPPWGEREFGRPWGKRHAG